MKVSAVTKHVTFDSAHYLVNPDLSREENMAQFHKCCLYKPDGENEPHGHTYHLEVTVFGTIDPQTGYVIDFKELKNILNEVLERVDHRLINNIPYFKEHPERLATVENILQYLWSEITPKIDSLRPQLARVVNLKIWETPDSFAELNVENIKWQKAVEMQQQEGAAVDGQESCCGGNCNCKNQEETNNG